MSSNMFTGRDTRRTFIKKSALGTVVATAAISGIIPKIYAEKSNLQLHFPPLPYPENGLEPYISAKTLKIHHGSHHHRFMKEVIARVKGTEYQDATLEKIIKETYGGITMIETLHLMALLSWNHAFYWKSMKPGGGGEISEKLKKAMLSSFGSVKTCKKKFKEAAMTLGSGWAWLVLDNNKLNVIYTAYHDTPLLKNQQPLLTIDCWEHAYYLDYQDRKEEYVDAYLNNLVNWHFAESNMPSPAVSAPKSKK